MVGWLLSLFPDYLSIPSFCVEDLRFDEGAYEDDFSQNVCSGPHHTDGVWTSSRIGLCGVEPYSVVFVGSMQGGRARW